MNALFADVVVSVHLLVVIFMIVGLLLILVGGLMRWSWVRNRWFRLTHLGIMAYIVINAIRGKVCFLTIWERELRRDAGQWGDHDISFVGRLFRDALYVEIPQASLDKVYLVFGALVIASIVFVRPRLRVTRVEAKSNPSER
jgi:hypothetical protein